MKVKIDLEKDNNLTPFDRDWETKLCSCNF